MSMEGLSRILSAISSLPTMCFSTISLAVAGDVVLDLLGVDHAAVAKDDAVLLLVERDVRLRYQPLRLLGIVAEALHDAALHEVLRDDFLHVLGLDLDVERSLREDLDDRALLAEAKAAGLDDLHGLGEAGGLKARRELLHKLVGSAGTARRSAADQHV